MNDFVPTRVSKVKEDAAKEFISVHYERSKKRKVEDCTESKQNLDKGCDKFDAQPDELDENIDERRKQELEMKRVRYEVMKFGMSGFKKRKAEKAHVALALSLGAKPSKKENINYKILQHRNKVSKEVRQKQLQHVSGLEKSLSNRKVKKGHKKNPDSILGVYGKVNKKVVGKSKK